MSEDKYKKKTLQIESRTENLIKIREFISNTAKSCGFDDDEVNKITLAVDEACTNIIKHAYKGRSDGIIKILLTMNKKNFKINIIDFGEPFNPQLFSITDVRSRIKNYTKGGLGMFLIRTLMDKVEYKINKNKRNQVTLIKYIAKE